MTTTILGFGLIASGWSVAIYYLGMYMGKRG